MKYKLLFSAVLGSLTLLATAAPKTELKNFSGKLNYNATVSSEMNAVVAEKNSVNFDKVVFKDINSMKRSGTGLLFQKDGEVLNAQKAPANSNVVPTALYKRPVGTYPYSLIGASAADEASIGLSYRFQADAGAAFAKPWQYRNKSLNALKSQWNWGNVVAYSTETDASFSHSNLGFLLRNNYYVPVLRAINGTDTANYNLPYITWSDGSYSSIMAASSGKAYMGLPDFYGNVAEVNDNQSSIFLMSDGTKLNGTGLGYVWGSCRRYESISTFQIYTRVKYIGTKYEKPMAPLTIEDVTFFGYTDVAEPIPAGKYLTLNVIKLDSLGKMTKDTLAKSVISKDDIILKTGGYLYLPFHFYQEDPETGREMVTPIVVKDAYALVLDGLEQNGVDFGIFHDYMNTLDNSAFFGKINEANKYLLGNYSVSEAYGMNLYVSIHGYFDYLFPEYVSRNMESFKSGGYAKDASGQTGSMIYSFNEDVVDSISGELKIWIKDSLPSWVTVGYDNSYYSQFGGILFVFDTQALPDSLNERSADITFQTLSSEATIHLVQHGFGVGVNKENTEKFEVKRTADQFDLAFGDGYTSVKLYNLSGKLVQNFNVENKNQLNIDFSSYTKGAYLLRFEGENVKILKLIY